ncbi:MAG TPA: S-layer homology domain-containing protein [Sphingomicrobium sp.]|jgi:hypothetical protein|nr:S-layer homology domain-containing protein [Sphingomicrobium sp.]
MNRKHAFVIGVVFGLIAAEVKAQSPLPKSLLPTTRRVPATFGTQDYSVTTVSATGFYPDNTLVAFAGYATSGSLGRWSTSSGSGVTEFYASLNLPAGAVIDYIGLNSTTDAAFAYGVNLLNRYKDGTLTSIGTFSSTVHGWDTDYNATPIGYTWTGAAGNALIINVEEGVEATQQYVGWVEVWWRRSVSPAPATADFGDVPTSSPIFQFVEALYRSGITAGCGGGNYCPNSPVTRGQMAVFLAKALGLNWPGAVGAP